MAILVWDNVGEKLFEVGTKKGVIYPLVNSAYTTGVAWNGLTSVSEKPSGADETEFWADDIKYGSLRAAEKFGATIEAYTYPDEFAVCDGSATPTTGVTVGQQNRRPFGFSYVSTVGNDTDGLDHGYKIHLIYNATVSPSERGYQTINDSPDAITFSWELASTPVPITGHPELKATSCLTIDSTRFTTDEAKAKLKDLEDLLYGTANSEPTLPMPGAVISMLSDES